MSASSTRQFDRAGHLIGFDNNIKQILRTATDEITAEKEPLFQRK